MIMDDPGRATFETDIENEFSIVFTVRDAKSPKGKRTLMYFRCFDEQRLRAIVIWMGERQHLWAEWHAIAEAVGGTELSARMSPLIEHGGFEAADGRWYLFQMCEGVSVIPGDGLTEVCLTMKLTTRTLVIISHKFKDVRSRDAFFLSLLAEDCETDCLELAELALLKGRNALHRKLDSIARKFRRTDPTLH